MTWYLISFPNAAMDVPEEEISDVARNGHAVIQEAKDTGVYIFSGGLNEDVEPVLVACRCSQEVREFQFDPLV